jgi:hypothetical protein
VPQPCEIHYYKYTDNISYMKDDLCVLPIYLFSYLSSPPPPHIPGTYKNTARNIECEICGTGGPLVSASAAGWGQQAEYEARVVDMQEQTGMKMAQLEHLKGQLQVITHLPPLGSDAYPHPLECYF